MRLEQERRVLKAHEAEKMLKYRIFIFSGKPIFTIDVHPDGTRFATGGQGER